MKVTRAESSRSPLLAWATLGGSPSRAGPALHPGFRSLGSGVSHCSDISAPETHHAFGSRNRRSNSHLQSSRHGDTVSQPPTSTGQSLEHAYLDGRHAEQTTARTHSRIPSATFALSLWCLARPSQMAKQLINRQPRKEGGSTNARRPSPSKRDSSQPLKPHIPTEWVADLAC